MSKTILSYSDSQYIAIATADLKERIENELLLPDPPKEVAKALLSEAYEKTDRDTKRAS
jgi:hypothetical protein